MEIQKWEYTEYDIPKNGAMQAFNRMGESGWELVAVVFNMNTNYTTAYFKRPKNN